MNKKLLGLFFLWSLILGAVHTYAASPSSVTVTGTMQKLMGCPDDWQPGCDKTHLVKNGDVWSGSFVLPAGRYEYKIALNNNWTESYGYNLSEKNAAFTLTEEKAVTFSYDELTHFVTDTAYDDGSGVIVIPPIQQPDQVTLVGNLQSILGCTGDWQANCSASSLSFDEANGIWSKTFSLPAGSYQYKVTLNGAWTENYGRFARAEGDNIEFELAVASDVTFYYQHQTHWITNDQQSVIATAVGDFQSYLGCADNWLPECMQGWLQDPNTNGLYTFSTIAIAPGHYQGKVAINRSWDESYGTVDGVNFEFDVTKAGQRVHFTFDAVEKKVYVGDAINAGDLSHAAAYWLDQTTLVWPLSDDVAPLATLKLHYAADGVMSSSPAGISGGLTQPLTYAGKGLSEVLAKAFPHLKNAHVYQLPLLDKQVLAEILKSKIAVSAHNANGSLVDATAVQFAGVLDDQFAYSGDLGVTFNGDIPTLRVWAPTAKDVSLHLYRDGDAATTAILVPMIEDKNSGVWSVTGDASWNRQFYQYQVKVFVRSTNRIENNMATDPYTLSASTDGKRSQIVNLKDQDLAPQNWLNTVKPTLAAPEDIVLYELHLRDFSIGDDSVPENLRGTYRAFTVPTSNGLTHLQKLADAGLTHVHFLPLADCATIAEDKNTHQVPAEDLSIYPTDSDSQQAAVNAIRERDGFNWCYDPHHYTLPEGSYATDAEGVARIIEFREMVKSLNARGLRVVMDVVYNHTSGSGLGEKSVLDKIVPNYYHRLNAEGDIETSTCCANTATEHQMMEKLMLDSLKTWAVDYKVDAFRFDIMGHHSKENIEKAKALLESLTPEEHGVNGKEIYLYGEGWNFGEVVDNARFTQASIDNMSGTGIGTFNNRIRDAVRGGGPFDTGIDHVKSQSIINGLYLDPNEENQATDNAKAALLMRMDQLRVVLAGSLKNYSFMGRDGKSITGQALDFEGQNAGYTLDPQESINYIEAHDNETLFDAIQYKAPLLTSLDDRVRMQNLGASFLVLSQGIPFIHAGQEILRSKSMDRNSYDAGDWFNVLDFTYTTNGWGRGLPLEKDNSQNWSVIKPRLADSHLVVDSGHIERAFEHMREMLSIRKSSKLFRLENSDAVQQHLAFHNTGEHQVPGLIVMSLTDSAANLDPEWEQIMVLFNADTKPQSLTIASRAGNNFALHPVQQASGDTRLATASVDTATGTFTVPARTTVVFVSKEQPKTVEPKPPITPVEPQPVKKKSGGSGDLWIVILLFMAFVISMGRRRMY